MAEDNSGSGKTVGFALVGTGMIAGFHARALADVPEARLVAVVSRDTAKARAFLDKQPNGRNAFATASLAEALARPDVDAVIITTPSGAHLDPALLAAQAGKHVVVEKPLEISAQRCDQIINACQKHGVKLATIFGARFGDANRELKIAVDSGRFGRLTLAEAACKWWRSQEYYDNGGWKGTQALDGGGALMNQAIHVVDLLLWMMGPVESVFAFTGILAHERIEVEDTAVAALRFRSGALGVIHAATSVYPGLPRTLAVHGDKGTVVIEQDDLVRWDFLQENERDAEIRDRFAKKTGASGGSSDPAAISHLPHARQLADFVRALNSHGKPLVDGKEGRRSVELIEAIYASARDGRVVRPGCDK